MIRAVLFDVYGTLLFAPLRAIYRRAAELGRILKSKGYFVRVEDAVFVFGRKWLEYSEGKIADDKEYVNACLKELCCNTVPEDVIDEILTFYTSKTSARLFPGVRETLEGLKARGLKLGVVSNSTYSKTMIDLKLNGIYEYFDAFCISSELRILKPDPRIFLKALAALGVSPADAVFVGDRPQEDIAGARAVGMKTILFQPQLEEEIWSTSDLLLKRTPFERRRSQKECKADAVINNIKDVLRVIEAFDSKE
ncbi:MAG: FMN and 5-amino-6-uracil phosphatase YigB [Candidatus Alkanophagales archaeon MCA70_species_1]|nr:FMN and 5-amino-6-uracil phosphatase YigB [Candidatus Alkanophaga volatiphilum]